MRNMLLTLLALGIFSCQDTDQAEPQLAENTFSVQRNNVKWSGVPEIRLDAETDSLTFLGISNAPNDEVIVMKIKFQGLGQYTLIKNQAYYYSTVGGDVLTSKYKLAPNSIGQLIVSKYDKDKKSIEGTFDIMLKNDWSYSENTIDTLNLTDGNFKGKIED